MFPFFEHYIVLWLVSFCRRSPALCATPCSRWRRSRTKRPAEAVAGGWVEEREVKGPGRCFLVLKKRMEKGRTGFIPFLLKGEGSQGQFWFCVWFCLFLEVICSSLGVVEGKTWGDFWLFGSKRGGCGCLNDVWCLLFSFVRLGTRNILSLESTFWCFWVGLFLSHVAAFVPESRAALQESRFWWPQHSCYSADGGMFWAKLSV